jgi:endonuclease III
MIREDNHTLAEMIDELRQRYPGSELPSKSGLHRYQAGLEEMMGRMREIDAAARVVVQELGESPDEKAGALLAQSITTLATHAALSAQQRDDVSIEEIRKLARAASYAMDARVKSRQERVAIRADAREELLREQREALDKVVKQGGLSEATAADFRRKILGVA